MSRVTTRVRAAHAERVAAWDARTREGLRRAGVDRLDLELPAERDLEALVRPLLRFFHMREARGAKR